MTKEDMEKGYLLNDNANDKEVSHEGTSSDQGQPGVSICSENLIFSCPTFWPN